MFTKNQGGFYSFTTINSPAVIHAVSTKSQGNMSPKYGNEIETRENQEKFALAVGFDLSRVARLNQIHGTTVSEVQNPGEVPDSDAAVTNVPEIFLWINTADCAPIIFFDPRNKAVGVAHSGWIGAVGKIGTKTVGKMVATFGSRPEEIMVGIGPQIGKCCYNDNMDPVQLKFPEWKNFLKEEPDGKYQVDLAGFIRNELLEIGILSQNIDDAKFCTKDHSDEFFCSQLETAKIGKPGRIATIIGLK